MSQLMKIQNDSSKWFFTADLHLRHDNIRTYCNRDFSTVEEMDATIIANINRLVGENDHLVIAGDFCMGDQLPFLKQINCRNLYFVLGSHDKGIHRYKHLFRFMGDKLNLELNGQEMVITHCPHLCWEKSHYGSWHLFGHIHSGKSPKGGNGEDGGSLFDQVIAHGKMLDIGVDGHDFCPWNFEEIKEVLDKKAGFLVKRSRVSDQPAGE